MLKRWTLAFLSVALIVAACSGSGTSPKTATVTSVPPTVAATVAATPTPVPARPDALRNYALAVARYLTASPAAASSTPCLGDLYAAWSMPGVTAAKSCMAGNTDDDPANEVAAVLSEPGDGEGAPIRFEVAIFDTTASGVRVAYETSPAVLSSGVQSGLDEALIAIGDVNGDGQGELVYEIPSCGAHTCFKAVHVIGGMTSGYVELTPRDGISMEFPELRLEDVDGDGKKEIVLHGGEIGSVGAGPQRKRREVWAWDGGGYALRSTTPDPAGYLYHAVKDADALLAAGKYADAEAGYLAAVGDANLKLWKGERGELEAYALFRAGLAELMAGGDRGKANGYLARANGYAGTLNHQLAGAFEAGFAAKGEISVGCGAVREDVQANLAEYKQFWDFGYGNPPFDPDTVCPF